MSWKLTCRDAGDGSGEVIQAQWCDGEAQGMRLCRSCFNYAMSTLKRERWVLHMFDDDEPEREEKE